MTPNCAVSNTARYRLSLQKLLALLVVLAIAVPVSFVAGPAPAMGQSTSDPDGSSAAFLPLVTGGLLSGQDQTTTNGINIFMATDSATGASITSEFADYLPGTVVTLIGAGWASGEKVHIFVNDNTTDTWIHDSDPDPVADNAGVFRYSFQLPDWFVATYGVLATGAVSGNATTTFTDAQGSFSKPTRTGRMNLCPATGTTTS